MLSYYHSREGKKKKKSKLDVSEMCNFYKIITKHYFSEFK